MDAQSCLEKIIGREKKLHGKSFVAPAQRGRTVRIRIGMFVWECRPDAEFSGWGVFEMCGPGQVRFLREAEPWEKSEYLESFEKHTLMLFYLDSRGIWWGRDFKGEKFVPVLLVEGHLQFDSIVAAFDGSSYWYDCADPRADAGHAQILRDSLKAEVPVKGLKNFHFTLRETSLYEMALIIVKQMGHMQKDVFMREIEKALQMGNAQMLECAEVDNGYRVTWRRESQTLTSLVDRNLSVISAGTCLSGQDALQDLTSLSSLISLKPAYGGDYGEYYH
jgi:hypothetical protein